MMVTPRRARGCRWSGNRHQGAAITRRGAGPARSGAARPRRSETLPTSGSARPRSPPHQEKAPMPMPLPEVVEPQRSETSNGAGEDRGEGYEPARCQHRAADHRPRHRAHRRHGRAAARRLGHRAGGEPTAIAATPTNTGSVPITVATLRERGRGETGDRRRERRADQLAAALAGAADEQPGQPAVQAQAPPTPCAKRAGRARPSRRRRRRRSSGQQAEADEHRRPNPDPRRQPPRGQRGEQGARRRRRRSGSRPRDFESPDRRRSRAAAARSPRRTWCRRGSPRRRAGTGGASADGSQGVYVAAAGRR